MYIYKILETKIDLHNFDEIYTSNSINIIKFKLKEKFENKCYKSCYIISINRIIRKSLIHISEIVNLIGQVNVTFEVIGLVYNFGEIITGAKIINKESNGRIQCKTDYASIEVDADDITRMYEIHDEIPLIVVKARYLLGKKNISIMAIVFQPIRNINYIYRFNGEIKEKDIKEMEILFENLNINLRKFIGEYLKKINKDQLAFFTELLYSFKKKSDYITKYNIKNYQLLNLDKTDLNKLNKGYYIIPNELDIYNKKFYKINLDLDLKDTNNNFIKNHKIIDEHIITIIERFINKYYIYISSLKELITHYNTIEKIKSQNVIFGYYVKKKNKNEE